MSRRIGSALALINTDLGKGIDPARISEFYARSFCPNLRNAPEIIDLFEATGARALADALVAPGGVKVPSMAQIALRFPGARPAVLPRPHVDGTYGPQDGVGALSVVINADVSSQAAFDVVEAARDAVHAVDGADDAVVGHERRPEVADVEERLAAVDAVSDESIAEYFARFPIDVPGFLTSVGPRAWPSTN